MSISQSEQLEEKAVQPLKQPEAAEAKGACVDQYIEALKSESVYRQTKTEPAGGQLDFDTPIERGSKRDTPSPYAGLKPPMVEQLNRQIASGPLGIPDSIKPSEKAPKGDKAETNAENVVVVKTEQDAQKLVDRARKENIPLVVHAPTQVCNDNFCTVAKLPEDLKKEFGNKAIFMQLPMDGLDLTDKASAELKKINDMFEPVEGAHDKKKVDAHVFNVSADKVTAVTTDKTPTASLHGIISEQIKKRPSR